MIKRDVDNPRQRLSDLVSIGPAMVADFKLLGIESIEQLAEQDPEELYSRLAQLTKSHQDICVLDTFRAAVAQARNPDLPAEQCNWWYYSQLRKAQTQ